MGQFSGFEIVMIVLMVWAIYLAPTIIGWRKRNRTAIAALNVLTGWTFIGWVVALVWALTKDAEPQHP